MILCCDCEYYDGDRTCQRPLDTKLDVIHGYITMRNAEPCRIERAGGIWRILNGKTCGPDAIYFETRNPHTLRRAP